jgi:transketolase
MFADGSEVHMVLKARIRPAAIGIAVRVFSMPGGDHFKNAPLSAWLNKTKKLDMPERVI